jgi:hypothetical protein
MKRISEMLEILLPGEPHSSALGLLYKSFYTVDQGGAAGQRSQEASRRKRKNPTAVRPWGFRKSQMSYAWFCLRAWAMINEKSMLPVVEVEAEESGILPSSPSFTS